MVCENLAGSTGVTIINHNRLGFLDLNRPNPSLWHANCDCR
jgi:hypothetical protein